MSTFRPLPCVSLFSSLLKISAKLVTCLILSCPIFREAYILKDTNEEPIVIY